MGNDGNFSLLNVVFGKVVCVGSFDCELPIDTYGIAFWVAMAVYLLNLLGMLCEGYFVLAIEEIVERFAVTADVAGALFFAPGSSSPELLTNLVATFFIVGEGGVGAVIGSLVYNVLIMVGAPSIVAPCPMKIWWYPVMRDATVFAIAVIELLVFVSDDKVVAWEAAIMVCTYLSYAAFMKFNSAFIETFGLERETLVEEINIPAAHEVSKPPLIKVVDLSVVPPPCDSNDDVQTFHNEGLRQEKPSAIKKEEHRDAGPPSEPEPSEGRSPSKRSYLRFAGGSNVSQSTDVEEVQKLSCCKIFKSSLRDPVCLIWERLMPDAHKHCYLLFIAAFLQIAVCTYVLIDAVTRIGTILNISKLVMGLLPLAVGTSFAGTICVMHIGRRGDGDLVMSDAWGSSNFGMLIGLGLPWLLAGIMGKPVEFPGAFAVLRSQLIFLAISTLIMLVGLRLNKWTLTRRFGIGLCCLYLVYVVFCIVDVYVLEPPAEHD